MNTVSAVCLRPLRWTDTRFCWRLASDQSVREASRDSSRPTLWKHLRWMFRQLHTEARAWIVLYGVRRGGVVRVTPFEPDGVEIHIALTPKVRGVGVGRQAIHLCAEMQRKPVYARIRPANAASLRAFNRAGFEERFNRGDFLVMQWTER